MSVSDLKKVGECLTPFHSRHPLYLDVLLRRYRQVIEGITPEMVKNSKGNICRKPAALCILIVRAAKRKAKNENDDPDKIYYCNSFMRQYYNFKECIKKWEEENG
jgi:hypothetical protein